MRTATRNSLTGKSSTTPTKSASAGTKKRFSLSDRPPPTGPLTGQESVQEAAQLEQQARLRERDGQDGEAIQLMERALQIRCRQLAALSEQQQEGPEAAAAQTTYAELSQEAYDAAERVVIKCNTFGVACFKQDQFTTAQPLLLYSLELTEADAYPLREVGQRRLHLRGVTLNNLGCLERRQGHYREALHYMKQSMEVTGEESAVGYMNMSAVLIQLRLNDDAAQTAERAVVLLQAHQGLSTQDDYAANGDEDPSLLAIAHHNLAMALEPIDRARCQAEYAAGCQVAREVLGPDHPTTALIESNWRRYQQQAGVSPKGQQHRRRKSSLSPAHPRSVGPAGAEGDMYTNMMGSNNNNNDMVEIFPHPFVRKQRHGSKPVAGGGAAAAAATTKQRRVSKGGHPYSYGATAPTKGRKGSNPTTSTSRGTTLAPLPPRGPYTNTGRTPQKPSEAPGQTRKRRYPATNNYMAATTGRGGLDTSYTTSTSRGLYLPSDLLRQPQKEAYLNSLPDAIIVYGGRSKTTKTRTATTSQEREAGMSQSKKRKSQSEHPVHASTTGAAHPRPHGEGGRLSPLQAEPASEATPPLRTQSPLPPIQATPPRQEAAPSPSSSSTEDFDRELSKNDVAEAPAIPPLAAHEEQEAVPPAPAPQEEGEQDYVTDVPIAEPLFAHETEEAVAPAPADDGDEFERELSEGDVADISDAEILTAHEVQQPEKTPAPAYDDDEFERELSEGDVADIPGAEPLFAQEAEEPTAAPAPADDDEFERELSEGDVADIPDAEPLFAQEAEEPTAAPAPADDDEFERELSEGDVADIPGAEPLFAQEAEEPTAAPAPADDADEFERELSEGDVAAAAAKPALDEHEASRQISRFMRAAAAKKNKERRAGAVQAYLRDRDEGEDEVSAPVPEEEPAAAPEAAEDDEFGRELSEGDVADIPDAEPLFAQEAEEPEERPKSADEFPDELVEPQVLPAPPAEPLFAQEAEEPTAAPAPADDADEFERELSEGDVAAAAAKPALDEHEASRQISRFMRAAAAKKNKERRAGAVQAYLRDRDEGEDEVSAPVPEEEPAAAPEAAEDDEFGRELSEGDVADIPDAEPLFAQEAEEPEERPKSADEFPDELVEPQVLPAPPAEPLFAQEAEEPTAAPAPADDADEFERELSEGDVAAAAAKPALDEHEASRQISRFMRAAAAKKNKERRAGAVQAYLRDRDEGEDEVSAPVPEEEPAAAPEAAEDDEFGRELSEGDVADIPDAEPLFAQEAQEPEERPKSADEFPDELVEPQVLPAPPAEPLFAQEAEEPTAAPAPADDDEFERELSEGDVADIPGAEPLFAQETEEPTAAPAPADDAEFERELSEGDVAAAAAKPALDEHEASRQISRFMRAAAAKKNKERRAGAVQAYLRDRDEGEDEVSAPVPEEEPAAAPEAAEDDEFGRELSEGDVADIPDAEPLFAQEAEEPEERPKSADEFPDELVEPQVLPAPPAEPLFAQEAEEPTAAPAPADDADEFERELSEGDVAAAAAKPALDEHEASRQISRFMRAAAAKKNKERRAGAVQAYLRDRDEGEDEVSAPVPEEEPAAAPEAAEDDEFGRELSEGDVADIPDAEPLFAQEAQEPEEKVAPEPEVEASPTPAEENGDAFARELSEGDVVAPTEPSQTNEKTEEEAEKAVTAPEEHNEDDDDDEEFGRELSEGDIAKGEEAARVPEEAEKGAAEEYSDDEL